MTTNSRDDTCGSRPAAARRMAKAYRALELVERWFIEDGDPVDDMGDCIFCKRYVLDGQPHADDCIFIALRDLIGGD